MLARLLALTCCFIFITSNVGQAKGLRSYDILEEFKFMNDVHAQGPDMALCQQETSNPQLRNICTNTANIKEKINLMRQDFKRALSDKFSFIIAYYSHVATVLGRFSGHFSPVAAYDSKTDMVLLMDVSEHIGSWYWIKLSDLFKIMYPDVGGRDRGYILVSAKDVASLRRGEIKNKIK